MVKGLRLVFGPLALLALWACSSSGASVPAPNQNSVAADSLHSVTPGLCRARTTLTECHAYVSSGQDANGILQYALPIANNERPLGTLKTLGPIFSLCADSGGRIAAADANQFAYGLDVYDQPISLGASPSFSLATSALPLYCSFDPVGNLYVTTFFDGANYSDIDVFFAPVRPGTAVGKRIPLNYQDHTRGLTADRNGNVFISNDRGIVEYSSLSTGNNIVARFGNSENGNIIRMGPDGNLYVDEGHSFHVYDAPFHSGQSFTRAIAVPLCSSLDMFIDSFAFDSAGDMILSCGFSSGTLLELAPPYTGPPIGVTSMTFPAQDIVVAP